LDLVDTDLQDLSQALTVAEQNPARFKLSPMDLVNRRKLLEDLKQKASYMRTRVRQTSTQPGTLSYKTDILADSVQQQQQALMKEQDQQMDQLADTVGTLKEVAVVIGNELDDQTRLLNDLEENVDQTSSRLDQGMRKMKEFMKDNAGML
jgi:t-SNARE syntaxin family protein